ncbi:MAG: arylamine N-acetyltransferase family protein [Acidimicrobiia bacterium]
MDQSTLDAYLERIGLSQRPEVSRSGLEELQRAHLTAVPFENLDVFARRGVRTDLAWSVPKVVERGRGGWCFEINGAFGSLLEALGFSTTTRAAVVLLESPESEPSHLVNQVDLDRPYLVDVGFGDSFITPLRLDTEQPQQSGDRWFRLVENEGRTTLEEQIDGVFSPRYRLETHPWSLADFDQASHRLQTEDGLHWTANRFATRLLDGGPDRVTLLEDRVKFYRNGEWQEQRVEPQEWDRVLDEWFGLRP